MNGLAKIVCYVVSLALSPTLVEGGSLFKCTDQDGNITYSDVTCPGSTAEKKEIQIQHSQPTPTASDDRWSVEDQAKRVQEQRAQEEQQRALTKAAKKERERQNQMLRTAEENREKANELHQEAQELYEEAGKKNLGASRRKAIIEQAKSLERQADVLLGRRETAAPTQVESLQQRVEAAEEQARQAEQQAEDAADAARRAENEARFHR